MMASAAKSARHPMELARCERKAPHFFFFFYSSAEIPFLRTQILSINEQKKTTRGRKTGSGREIVIHKADNATAIL